MDGRIVYTNGERNDDGNIVVSFKQRRWQTEGHPLHALERKIPTKKNTAVIVYTGIEAGGVWWVTSLAPNNHVSVVPFHMRGIPNVTPTTLSTKVLCSISLCSERSKS